MPKWSTVPFVELHQLVLSGVGSASLVQELLAPIADDLARLVLAPAKNDALRDALVKLGSISVDGREYLLNLEFVEGAVQLADELDLDASVAAQILLHASEDTLEESRLGTLFLDSGRLAFYNRRQYILYIVLYLLNQPGASGSEAFVAPLLDTILQLFAQIEKELAALRDQIGRYKLMGTSNLNTQDIAARTSVTVHDYALPFMHTLQFKRLLLYRQHQTLGEILAGWVASGKASGQDIVRIGTQLDKYEPHDLFAAHLLPGLLGFWDVGTEDAMRTVYEHYKAVQLPKPMASFVALYGAVRYLAHLKAAALDALQRLSFTTDFFTPIVAAVGSGALEQMMCVCAEIRKDHDDEGYDLRQLLQQWVPRLVPSQVLDVDVEATRAAQRKAEGTSDAATAAAASTVYFPMAELPALEMFLPQFVHLLVPSMHAFVVCFTQECALVLVHLKNSEEDAFLLQTYQTESQDVPNVSMDELAERADVERFYMAVHFLYAERPLLASQFWDSLPESDNKLLGFVEWALHTTSSPLMTAAFCYMVAALGSGSSANGGAAFRFLDQPPGARRRDVLTWQLVRLLLKYYVLALAPPQSHALHLLLASPRRAETGDGVAEMGEDLVVFVAGFLRLVAAVAASAEGSDREQLATRFTQPLALLLRLLWNDGEPCPLRFPLVACVLGALRLVAHGLRQLRVAVWRCVDEWLYNHSPASAPTLAVGAPVARAVVRKPLHQTALLPEVFGMLLTTFPDVLAFARLVDGLTRPIPASSYERLALPSPYGLGSEYRSAGVWLYLEYMLTHVLVTATPENLVRLERLAVVQPVLQTMHSALTLPDLEFLFAEALQCWPAFDADSVVGEELDESKPAVRLSLVAPPRPATFTPSFAQYVCAHPVLAVMSYVFMDKVYRRLFHVLAAGADSVNLRELGLVEVQCVLVALQVLERVLALQEVYRQQIVPLLRAQLPEVYVPQHAVGTHGLRLFAEALLFNLPTVVHIALYVGVRHAPVAQVALRVLERVAALGEFGDTHLRLVGCLDLVDELVRVRFAFHDQLTLAVVLPEVYGVKVRLLRFLHHLLQRSASLNKPSVAHALLGFDVLLRATILLGAAEAVDGLIALHGPLVFRAVVDVMLQLLEAVNGVNVDYLPMRLAALAATVLVALCEQPLTRTLVLGHLRETTTVARIVLLLVRVGPATLWLLVEFDGALNGSNVFVSETGGAGAVLAFLELRARLVRLLLLEVQLLGAGRRRDALVQLLVGAGGLIVDGEPRVLALLDAVELAVLEVAVGPGVGAAQLVYNVQHLVNTVALSDVCVDGHGVFDLGKLEQTFKLQMKLWREALRAEQERQLVEQGLAVLQFVVEMLFATRFHALQRETLAAWATLVEGLVASLPQGVEAFALEVLQLVVPKMNDFMELDVEMVGGLVALCTTLWRVCAPAAAAAKDGAGRNLQVLIDRLFPLFCLCIAGLMHANAHPQLRANMYVLATQYVVAVIETELPVLEAMLQTVKGCDARLVAVVCGDAVNGEGPLRVAALLVLEQLLVLAARHRFNYILYQLSRSNYLALLVRLLSRTDQVLAVCASPGVPQEPVTLDTLLYELTAFKSAVYVLVRVAQLQVGAQLLVQLEVLLLVRQLRFVNIDPDVGLTLRLGPKLHPEVCVVLLDAPLDSGVLYYEILVPVFQLVAAVAVLMGPGNLTVGREVEQLMQQLRPLVMAVVKREAAGEQGGTFSALKPKFDATARAGMAKLVKLFSLLREVGGAASASTAASASATAAGA